MACSLSENCFDTENEDDNGGILLLKNMILSNKSDLKKPVADVFGM